ncbi:MutS-related protein [Chitinophaga lutea]
MKRLTIAVSLFYAYLGGMQPASIYQQRIAAFQSQLAQTEARLRNLGVARLLCFVLIAFAVYKYVSAAFAIAWLLLALAGAAAFVASLVYYQRTKERQALLKAMLLLNEQEYRVVTEHVAGFPDGTEFIRDEHDFSSDLDLFGPSSLYQYLNRTGTLSGAQHLAQSLQEPSQSAEAIRSMQEAVKELSAQLEFRQLYTAHARLAQEGPKDTRELRLWMDAPSEFVHRKGLRGLIWLMPALMLAAIVYYAAGGSYVPVTFLLFVNWGILLGQVKKVNNQHLLLSNKENLLKKYARLLGMIREASWPSAPWLKERQRRAQEADTALRGLARISNLLDQRLNLLVGFVLNSLMLYDLHCIFRLERWKEAHRRDVGEWLDVIAQLETAVSLGTFAYNHPGYIFPSVNDTPVMRGKAIGHPLIPAEECVVNDCSIGENDQFLIITGSNMSGKSTFLRSVGVNWLLAMTGAPVCAAEFACHPLRIMTSMRIRDSIARHTSYFQAELQRLQHIIKALQTGRRVFIILDEILKGTNSEDKLTGSRELIRHFLQYNCLGMIATHDLELGAMEQEHPNRIRNYCFESSLDNGQLHFDYTMRPGIARNKNATFLMRQMGII